MIENNEIEKDIKNAASSYSIKLSSDDILQAYEKRQLEKKEKRVFHFPKLKFAFGSLACVAVVLAIAIPSIMNNNKTPSKPVIITPQENVKWGTRSQTAFQIFTGLNLISSDSTSNWLLKKRTIDDSSFNDLVITYDKSVDTLNLLFQDGLDKENKIEKGSFEGEKGKYQYRMIISQYTFLTNMSFEEDDDEQETKFEGEIVNESSSNYYVEIEKETNPLDNEEEIEMKIHITDNYRIEIEQEHENNEVEYQYSIYEFDNDKPTYKENILIENKKDKISSCEIEVEKLGKEYKFEKIHCVGEILYCDYKMEDFSGTLILEYLNDGRQYKDQETQITKKI